jgi:small subunit ribosomal protein S4e
MVAPKSWGIARKTNKFITKPSPGPHNANALPAGVWLRDHMGFANTKKEAKQILRQRDMIVNGRPCRHFDMGIGIFDIIALPKINKYYRLVRDRAGRHKSVEISAEASESRLAKIANKTLLKGGKVQLNLRDGSNLLGDNTYKSRDSIEVSLKEGEMGKILDHFPFAVGNVAMVVDGRHSGSVGKIKEIIPVFGSVPNRVILTDVESGVDFETIDQYVIMVGREQSAVANWGIDS